MHNRTKHSNPGGEKTQLIYTPEGDGEQVERIRNQRGQSHQGRGSDLLERRDAFQNKTGSHGTKGKTSLWCEESFDPGGGSVGQMVFTGSDEPAV